MTLRNKIFGYLNKGKEEKTIEIALYDSLDDQNYFESPYSIILENSFKGTIVCLGDVRVKRNASFSGTLMCRTCKIEGSFKGSLLSTEYAGVCHTANLDAKITTASISIESSATVKGIFNITKDIADPEPIRTLHAHYKQPVDEIDDAQSTDLKTILLKGTPSVSAIENPTPESEKKQVSKIKEAGVSQITSDQRSEAKINRLDEPASPSGNVGWW